MIVNTENEVECIGSSDTPSTGCGTETRVEQLEWDIADKILPQVYNADRIELHELETQNYGSFRL